MEKGFVNMTVEALQDLQHAQKKTGDLKDTKVLEELLLLSDRQITIDNAIWLVNGMVRICLSGELPDSKTGHVRLFYTYDEPHDDAARKLTLKIEPYQRPEATSSK